MNKAELTAAIVKKTGFTKKDAEKAIAAVTDVITETLAAGEKVQIVGFGGFEVRSRPARVARNPRTGEQISIEASKAPVFKAEGQRQQVILFGKIAVTDGGPRVVRQSAAAV